MSGELEKKHFIEGEVVNAISKSFLVETNDPQKRQIELVRNSLTMQFNPLLAEVGIYSKVKMEVIDGPYGKVYQIIELTKLSALAAYERTYGDLLAKGRTTIPDGLSNEAPAPITLEEYRITKEKEAAAKAEAEAAKARAKAEADEQALYEQLPAVLRPLPTVASLTTTVPVGNQNGNGHSNNGSNGHGSNGTNGKSVVEVDERKLWQLTPEGSAVVAGD